MSKSQKEVIIYTIADDDDDATLRCYQEIGRNRCEPVGNETSLSNLIYCDKCRNEGDDA